MSLSTFVAGVDRLLTRAHELYPAGDALGPLTSGGSGEGAPSVPAGVSGVAAGASRAGEGYQRSQSRVSGLDGELEQATREGDLLTQQGRAGSGAIRDQARMFASSAAPLGNTAAGAQLVVATMDQNVQAMQRQLDTTCAGFQGVTERLRATGADYRGIAGDGPGGDAPADGNHMRMAGFDRKLVPDAPANTMIDPNNPFVGDERFGHWEKYTPPPYVGATPPPPTPEHRSLEGLPAKTGGPSGFYTPGQTWIDGQPAPYASLSEEYKFRISGEDATSYTRSAMVDGQPQLQRWVANTYESQKITQLNLGGDAWAKTDPNELEGTLGGVTTGGLAGITPPPHFGEWAPVTPQQMTTLSAANPSATFYIPDGCGGQFTFKGGSPVGGGFLAPAPTTPIMTAGP